MTVRVADGATYGRSTQVSSDQGTGHVRVVRPDQFVPGTKLHVSATDSRSNPDDRATGVLWSNTATITM